MPFAFVLIPGEVAKMDIVFEGLPNTSTAFSSDIFSASGFAVPRASPSSVEFPGTISADNNDSASAIYCDVCRKSFASEATWLSHQRTARHLTAEKEAQRKQERRNSKGKVTGGKSAAASEASLKVRQADKLANANPSVAATLYWTAASVLWTNQCVRDTAQCLYKLINVLNELKSSPPPSTGNPTTVVLKSSQIAETMYLARIALARLMSIYDCDVALALYIEALEGRHGITLESLAAGLEDVPVNSMLTKGREVLRTTVKPSVQKPAKRVGNHSASPSTNSDMRTSVALRKLQSILIEVMSFAINVEAPIEALAFGAVAAAIAEEDGRWADVVDITLRLGQIYINIDRPWSACDCLEAGAKACVPRDSIAESARQHDQSETRSVRTEVTEIGLLADALIFAIHIDDRVRISHLESHIVGYLQRLEATVDNSDLHFLLNLAKASRTLDHNWISDGEGEYQFDGLESGVRLLPEVAWDNLNMIWHVRCEYYQRHRPENHV